MRKITELVSTGMLRVRFTGQGESLVERVGVPVIHAGEVLVRVRAAGLCGSDLHALYRAETGSAFTPGHEVAGEVVACEGTIQVHTGDRVAVHAALGCGSCPFCRRGQLIMCSSANTLGFARDGGDAEYVVVPERACLPLPSGLSYEVGALIGDVVGTPYRALCKAGFVRGGETLGVYGLGPIGLGVSLLGMHFGARVIGVDVNPYRLTLSRRLGLAEVFNANEVDVSENIMTLTNGRGVDVAMECSGTDSGLRHALEVTKHFGHVALVGEHRGQAAALGQSQHFLGRELTMTGTRYYHMSDYDALLDLIGEGLQPERIVTHRFALSDASTAFRLFDSGETGKVLLTVGELS